MAPVVIAHRGDFTVMKHHQQLDEIMIYFTQTSRKSAKLFTTNSVRRMLYETRVRIYNKPMLIAQDCASFAGVLHDKSFLENDSADFPDVVRVKKNEVYV